MLPARLTASHFDGSAGIVLAVLPLRDNPVYHVEDSPGGSPMADHPNLPTRIAPDRLPSTVAALADIPKEEIWLQKQKSARTRRAYRLDVRHFMAMLGIATSDEHRRCHGTAAHGSEMDLDRPFGVSLLIIGRILELCSCSVN
jgi:hypothetical protein